MPAATRSILTLLSVALLAGCGDSRSSSPRAAASASMPPIKPTSGPVGADAHQYDAYGPRQYSIFNGVNRDNIGRAATGPTTGPVDDSVLLPADDDEW